MRKKTRGSKGKPGHREAGGEVRLPPGVAHPIDIHVGDRLRARRTLLGLTQERLAQSVGLTFQQIQKYERGSNRIGASRLYEFSRLLGVTVDYFFEDLNADLGDPAEGYKLGMAYDNKTGPVRDQANKRETLELVRAFYKIEDPTMRGALIRMFQSLASAPDRTAAAKGPRKSGK